MIPRITPLNSLVLVVDVQDKLLAAMPDAAGLIRDVAFLLDAAAILSVPVLATEQYPQGLGPTTAELAKRLPTGLQSNVPAKVAFSCCGASGLLASIRATGRTHIVLVGMETHVCILQTALDLLAEGLQVVLPVDGVQSRFTLDRDTALRRLERAGATLSTVETTAFEWLGGADHPSFRAISKLVRTRDEAKRNGDPA
jgi:nicotinamidase-related amidase